MKPSKPVKAEVERLVANWGYWNAAKEGIASACLTDAVRGGDVFEGPRIPILYGDAEEVDIVMMELAAPRFAKLRRALELQFIWKPPVHQRYEALAMRQRSYYNLVDAAIGEFWGRLSRLRGRALDTAAKKSRIPATVGVGPSEDD